jgi:hypothetical protein
MSITDVIISNDKNFACVIINSFITIFFKFTLAPIRLGSFTWPCPAIVTFNHDGQRALIILPDRGRMFQTSVITQPRRLVTHEIRRLDFKDGATCCCWRTPAIYIGLKNGHILTLDVRPDSIAKSETRQIKGIKAGVTRMRVGEKDTILTTDERGNWAVVVSNETVMPIQGQLRNAVLFSSTAMLAHVKGQKWLRILAVGSNPPIISSVAARRCPLMRPPKFAVTSFHSEAKTSWTCIRYGFPLLGRILGITPVIIREQARLLRGICRELRSRALRFALLLSDFEDAQNLLLETNPTDPGFIQAMLKTALLGRKDGDEGRELAAAGLITHGWLEDAIDIFLLSGKWESVVRKLIDFDRLADAAMVCRIQEPSNLRTALLEEIALMMLESGMIEYGLILLAEAGKTEQIAGKLRQFKELEQAEFLVV